MADLRESGQLEADADVIMLMHRDPDEPYEIEYIVAKNRHGANGVSVLMGCRAPSNVQWPRKSWMCSHLPR